MPPPYRALDERSVSIQLYSKRWMILLIYFFILVTNSFHLNQYLIITDIVERFYGVSSVWVNWTGNMCNLFYVALALPVDLFLERYGLRTCVIVGAALNACSAWVKVASVAPDRGYLVILAQVIVSISQVFILGLPSRLAAVWFGANEVSTACGIGVLASQLGVAISAVVPPVVIPDGNKGAPESAVQAAFLNINIASAAACSLAFGLALLLFSNEPASPPSAAQATAAQRQEGVSYLASLKSLAKSRNFVLLFVSYGLVIGVLYTFSTLMNQILHPFLKHENNRDELIGFIGLSTIIAGNVGSLIAGPWLDRTHSYKWTCVAIYGLSAAAFFSFTFTLDLDKPYIIFITTGFVGFFLVGYLPLGYEFGAELTYPVSEGTVANLLQMAGQGMGSIITFVLGYVIMKTGSVFTVNLAMSAILVVGLLMTFLIGNDLRRQRAETIQRRASSVRNGSVS